MFKGLGDMAALLRQASQVSGRVKQLSEDLKQQRAVASAGGGMVELEVNGLMEVVRLRIDPQLVAQGDVELLEDLVSAAISQAVQKAKQLHTEALKQITGGVSLPMMDDALASLMGGGPAEPAAAEPSPPEPEKT